MILKCNRCLIKKNTKEFHKDPHAKCGYQSICKLCCRARRKKYLSKNIARINKRRRELRQLNQEKIREQNRRYRQTNLGLRIAQNLRRRLRSALKRNTKAGSAVRDLGCSIKHLKIHLENQFKVGMSWDNYGVHGWHIDHIKPLSSFDLSSKEQHLVACSYKNLQPLWCQENLSKGTKLK